MLNITSGIVAQELLYVFSIEIVTLTLKVTVYYSQIGTCRLHVDTFSFGTVTFDLA